jgi:thioredoxin-related protein
MKKISLFFVLISLFFSGFIKAQESLNWLTLEEAEKKMAKQPKKLLIDVYTDWCGWCKVMDQQTFQHPTIAKIINQYFYPVKFNAEQKEDIVFRGRTFKYIPNGRSGYNELAAEILQGKLSYPTIVYMDEEFNVIQPVPGFYKPADIEPVLKFFGTNAYKTTDWATYQANFKSELPK